MVKSKLFFGKVVTGQVLNEAYTIDWNSEFNETKYESDLVIKKENDVTPSVNHEKWKRNISEVEIVNELNVKNVASSIIRGTVGSVALGGVGAVAGIMSAKSNTTFNVLIKYYNNQLDLIECDIRLYTKLQQLVNENVSLGLNEYENVYYSEEENKENIEEYYLKGGKYDYIIGLGCIVFILGGIVLFLVWLISLII